MVTDKSKEAMKLALEALQEVYWSSRSAKHDEAITALREALAEQPAQQEPVGTYGEIYQAMHELLKSGKVADQQVYQAMRDKALYTSPQPAQRKPLTDEQLEQIMEECNFTYNPTRFARAIEAAHVIKEKTND